MTMYCEGVGVGLLVGTYRWAFHRSMFYGQAREGGSEGERDACLSEGMAYNADVGDTRLQPQLDFDSEEFSTRPLYKLRPCPRYSGRRDRIHLVLSGADVLFVLVGAGAGLAAAPRLSVGVVSGVGALQGWTAVQVFGGGCHVAGRGWALPFSPWPRRSTRRSTEPPRHRPNRRFTSSISRRTERTRTTWPGSGP